MPSNQSSTARRSQARLSSTKRGRSSGRITDSKQRDRIRYRVSYARTSATVPKQLTRRQPSDHTRTTSRSEMNGSQDEHALAREDKAERKHEGTVQKEHDQDTRGK